MEFDQYFYSLNNYALTLDQQSHERARTQRQTHTQQQTRSNNSGRGSAGQGQSTDGGRGRVVVDATPGEDADPTLVLVIMTKFLRKLGMR